MSAASPEDLLAIGDRLVGRAAAGEQVEVFVARGDSTEVRVWGGEVEHFVSAHSEGVGVRVVSGGRTGTAYAGTLEASAVDEVLEEARANAVFGTPDEFAGLVEPDGVDVVPIELWDERLPATSTEDKIALVTELERITLGLDGRVRVDEADYSDGGGESAIVTTTGIRRHRRANSCHVSVSALADDGDETQTGFGFSVGDAPADLDLAEAARDAVDRATRLLGATKPRSRRTTVVLDPFVTAQVLGIIGSTLNGESVVKGRSLFRDRLGETIAAPGVTLIDDPTDPRAFTATDVDGEGLAARRNVLIDGGRLEMFVHSGYSARRASTVSTGNAIRGGVAGLPGAGCLALQLIPGARAQDELIASIDDGVLVQSVSGIHSGVNTVSGDFSTGASGMSIVNGSIAAPVREFTIATTLQRLLLDIVEVGADLRWLPMRSSGMSLVIGDVTVSGSS